MTPLRGFDVPKPNYQFIKDDACGILQIVIRNHWDLATTEQFSGEVQALCAKVARERELGRHWHLMIDASEHGVQSQEVILHLRELVADRDRIFDRTAIIVSGALHQMQAKRVRSSTEEHRICGSKEEALAWLTSDQPASTTAA